MRSLFCFPEKFLVLETRRRNRETPRRAQLCKNYFVIYCAPVLPSLPSSSVLSPGVSHLPYLFIVGLFMTSRPLPADLCRGRRRRSSRNQSRLRLLGVRCVLKLLMRKLLSRAGNCELNRIGNWPLEVQQQGSFSATILTESTGNHLIRSPPTLFQWLHTLDKYS